MLWVMIFQSHVGFLVLRPWISTQNWLELLLIGFGFLVACVSTLNWFETERKGCSAAFYGPREQMQSSRMPCKAVGALPGTV